MWSAAGDENEVSLEPGYYAIFVDEPSSLPDHFRERLRASKTKLIYVGIAERTLRERMVHEDMRGEGPSSFFRSLGLVLGFRPTPGSLWGKRNQVNFRFSTGDTKRLVSWAKEHLSASWRVDAQADEGEESRFIRELKPAFNLKGNPEPDPVLRELRREALRLARGQGDFEKTNPNSVTGARVIDEAGYPVLADPFGNNVAFRCLGCGAPVLATLRENQRGSEPARPSKCPACRAGYWLEANVDSSILTVRRVSPPG
jgi:hypothetical protein